MRYPRMVAGADKTVREAEAHHTSGARCVGWRYITPNHFSRAITTATGTLISPATSPISIAPMNGMVFAKKN